MDTINKYIANREYSVDDRFKWKTENSVRQGAQESKKKGLIIKFKEMECRVVSKNEPKVRVTYQDIKINYVVILTIQIL